MPEGLQPMERTHAGEVCGGLSPVGGTPRWSRGRARSSPPPEEEGAAKTRGEEPTPAPVLVPLRCWGEEVEKIRSGVEPQKKGGVGGRCLKIQFYFSLSYSDLIGNKLN